MSYNGPDRWDLEALILFRSSTTTLHSPHHHFLVPTHLIKTFSTKTHSCPSVAKRYRHEPFHEFFCLSFSKCFPFYIRGVVSALGVLPSRCCSHEYQVLMLAPAFHFVTIHNVTMFWVRSIQSRVAPSLMASTAENLASCEVLTCLGSH